MNTSIQKLKPIQIPCKICAYPSSLIYSIDNEHSEPHLLDIYLCKSCGLLFVGNPISNEQLNRAYGTFDSKLYYQEVATNTNNKINRSIQDLGEILKNHGNHPDILDIGCGYGHFLENASKSFPSVPIAGQELPGESANACLAKGFKIFTSELEEIPDKFTIIVLLDVAEHVPDPNTTFLNCYNLIKNYGCMYLHTPRRCFWDTLFLNMMKIPGCGTLSKAWLRGRVSIFHLQLWTDKALQLSLHKARFDLIYLKPEMELSWPLENYTKVYLKDKMKLPAPLVALMTLLAKVLFIQWGTLKNKAICLARKKSN